MVSHWRYFTYRTSLFFFCRYQHWYTDGSDVLQKALQIRLGRKYVILAVTEAGTCPSGGWVSLKLLSSHTVPVTFEVTSVRAHAGSTVTYEVTVTVTVFVTTAADQDLSSELKIDESKQILKTLISPQNINLSWIFNLISGDICLKQLVGLRNVCILVTALKIFFHVFCKELKNLLGD
jgi:hypothetical protein